MAKAEVCRPHRISSATFYMWEIEVRRLGCVRGAATALAGGGAPPIPLPTPRLIDGAGADRLQPQEAAVHLPR